MLKTHSYSDENPAIQLNMQLEVNSSFRAPIREVKWDRPTGFKFIVNIDGSSLGNSRRVDFRAMIRNIVGKWI